MENASKALIIAGAILLSILIISLGIMIYRQATESVNTDAMEEVSIMQFNEKFTQYTGDHVRGSNVNALLSSVAQNNLTYSNDESKKIQVIFDSKDVTTSLSTTKALTGYTYDVDAYTNTAGYVYKITISQQSANET